MTTVSVESIPKELKNLPQWVGWRREERNGKLTKVPYNASTGNFASITNPGDWATFEQAISAFQGGGYDGVGFVLTKDDPFTGIDLDHCLDPATGVIEPWALSIIEQLNSYTERSPSGTGIRIFVLGKLPPGRRRKGPIEFYDAERYLTVTGHHLPGTPTAIEDCHDQLQLVHAAHFPKSKPEPHRNGDRPPHPITEDDQVRLARMFASEPGTKIKALWNGKWQDYFPSQSEADSSLCFYLAFWFGRDPERLDRVFRQSGLMRDKWDSPRGDSTYGADCIANACKEQQDTYQEPLRMTDVGSGERFAAQHRGNVHFCYAMKQWLVWDGRRWKLDDGKAVMALAKQTARSLDLLVAREPDEAKRKVLRKWATESERKHRLEAALYLAQSEPGMAIEIKELDADPMLLNVQNGTLDLRTGELRPHSREDYITKMALVDYDPEAPCPKLESLLNRLFEKVPNIRAYLQRIFGYSLTGLITEQCFFIFYGIGSNGKSTILRAIFDLMGEYAVTTRPETFLIKHGDEGIRNDVAALAGARFVTSLESEQGKQLAEGLIKGVTGDEKVSARFLRKEFFAFQPQFKLFIGTNHKPTIKGTDHGIWRRVRLVPFLEMINEEERDRSFGEKLRGESSGILNWLLEGCKAWQRDGLGEPVEVVKATGDYREEQDVLGQFLDDRCVVEKDGTCTKGDLYIAYQVWSQNNGQRHPQTKNSFGRALRERGFTDARVYGEKGWAGLRLRTT